MTQSTCYQDEKLAIQIHFTKSIYFEPRWVIANVNVGGVNSVTRRQMVCSIFGHLQPCQIPQIFKPKWVEILHTTKISHQKIAKGLKNSPSLVTLAMRNSKKLFATNFHAVIENANFCFDWNFTRLTSATNCHANFKRPSPIVMLIGQ